MKKILACIGLMAVVAFGFGQVELTPKTSRGYTHCNAITLELAGNGGAYSVNYERILINAPHLQTGVRAGIGVTPPFMSEMTPQFRLPVMVLQQFSCRSHHIEAGAGLTMTNVYNFPYESIAFMFERVVAYGALRLGYNYQRPAGRLILKAAYTPFVGIPKLRSASIFVHHAGLTLGYAF